MADDFGLKIGLEGEKEFKKALTEINQSFKVLGSEMKVVQSQFDKNDNSVEALTARNQVLNKEIEAQKQKIETLRQALANASESFGENDRRTQQWQIQLNNATAALNDMERELDRNNTALDEVEKEMDDAADSADDLEEELADAGDAADDSEGKFSKLGGTLKTVGIALGAVVTAAAATAVSLGKAVVEAYSEYEQLVGGVDTLFKESSGLLQEYANNAYKTAGMSANDYMATVTSFSAALIQSLGGDTEAAVKYADMAITDMADNANKMGSDIATIQTAYQGFAKGQFTLLDNLKLGYGGTQEEMKRLLADAQAISGIEYDISSYADIVDAIHVIQESVGIAGATAAEAEHTIEGSMNSMKAAIDNLVVGFGNADADIEQLCNNVVDAFQDVLVNITPVIENIISALPVALNAAIGALGSLLPTLLETVTDLFSQVLSTLLSLLPELIPPAIQAVLTLVNTVIENLPLVVDSAVQLVMSLVEGIGTALPDLIPAATEAVVTIVQSLISNLPLVLDAALQLISGLSEGLLSAIPVLIAALPEIILSIIDFLIGSIPQIIETGIMLLTSLISALPTIIVEVCKAAPQIISGLVSALGQGVSQLAQVGGNLVRGLWQGIQSLAGWLWNKVSAWVSSIWDGICDFFGIASPSKEMGWVGEMLVEGLAGAINANGKDAVAAAEGMSKDINDVMHGLADDMTTALPSNIDLGTATYGISGSVSNAGSSDTIGTLIALLTQYLPYLPQIANMQLVTDTGALVGELAAPMNLALGKISIREAKR